MFPKNTVVGQSKTIFRSTFGNFDPMSHFLSQLHEVTPISCGLLLPFPSGIFIKFGFKVHGTHLCACANVFVAYFQLFPP